MRTGSLLLLTFLILMSCQSKDSNPVYKSEHFTIYPDKVVQGEYEAQALSPYHITSNYQSPANQSFSSRIEYKFSINAKDNELPVGENHIIVVEPVEGGVFESPLITFGVRDENDIPNSDTGSLPPNTRFKLRLDFRPVLEAFEKEGYYTTFNGDKIAKSDFKGVYVAGNASPLTWDFVNLMQDPQRELKDEDGDGIYETILTLNAFESENFTAQEWKLKNDISDYPALESDYLLVDALYNLSLDETIMNKEADGTFRTGEAWPGVWTRDISYSVLLAYAIIDPEFSKTSLLKKIKRDRIIQDTGSGGAWPVSSDRTTWALAAWEIYVVTGDKEWLAEVYKYIKNSVADDEQIIASGSGLIRGESSFLDWREQSYPGWMDNVDIHNSHALGTNAVHYMTYRILFHMSQILGEESKHYLDKAKSIQDAINRHLWMEDKGYYGQYRYGRYYQNLSARSETLGEALCVISGVAHNQRSAEIIRNTPVVEYGAPCFFPNISGKPPYHNNGIWPFVQAYWNWASAIAGNEKALDHGLASIYRASALFLTNKENMVAGNGDFRDTEVNSNRQLWSVAGNLAMIYRVFYGMLFTQERIELYPTVPKAYAGTWNLKNFKYRNAVLDLSLTGYGNEIESILLDGMPLDQPHIPADLEGNHSIEIMLANTDLPEDNINLVSNQFDLPAPLLSVDGNKIEWQPVEGAANYRVYENGKPVGELSTTQYETPESKPLQIKVSSIDTEGQESFTSEPVWLNLNDQLIIVETEKEATSDPRFSQAINFSGKGFSQTSNTENTLLSFDDRSIPKGKYLVSVRYSNGNGPWNTDNKCAIRTLYLNDERVGPIIMPQRGVDEWSSWAYSNFQAVEIEDNAQLSLRLDPSDINMNVEVNEALIDHIRLIPID